MAGIVLNPGIASSAADSKYPASDFELSVIYIDKDAVSTFQAQNEYDPKYPAAYFKPKVIYP